MSVAHRRLHLRGVALRRVDHHRRRSAELGAALRRSIGVRDIAHALQPVTSRRPETPRTDRARRNPSVGTAGRPSAMPAAPRHRRRGRTRGRSTSPVASSPSPRRAAERHRAHPVDVGDSVDDDRHGDRCGRPSRSTTNAPTSSPCSISSGGITPRLCPRCADQRVGRREHLDVVGTVSSVPTSRTATPSARRGTGDRSCTTISGRPTSASARRSAATGTSRRGLRRCRCGRTPCDRATAPPKKPRRALEDLSRRDIRRCAKRAVDDDRRIVRPCPEQHAVRRRAPRRRATGRAAASELCVDGVDAVRQAQPSPTSSARSSRLRILPAGLRGSGSSRNQIAHRAP